jgi:signal transduction histidine kinase
MGLTDEGNPTEQGRFGSTGLASTEPRPSPPREMDLEPALALEHALADEQTRNEQLRLALREVEESTRRGDDLISMVSHDLRSPLSSIQLNVQSVLRSTRPVPHWIRLRLLRAEELIRYTAQLINDILIIERGNGRAPSDAGSEEEIDLHAFIRHAVSLLDEQIAAARCSVTIQCDGRLVGRWDRVYLSQIVSNLVSNAIKYGAGKPFEIVLGRCKAGVRIVISDHGIGLADGDHQRIFERFEQLRPTDSHNGVGLGLWIVAEAAHRLNATIRLRSIPGEGSTFIVELPAR